MHKYMSKRIKIHEVETEYIINDGIIYPTEDIQARWDNFDEEQKKGWHTTRVKKADIRAIDLLDRAYEELEQYGYEDMAAQCWDDTPEALVEELQNVLDKICQAPAFEIYFAETPIDDE